MLSSTLNSFLSFSVRLGKKYLQQKVNMICSLFLQWLQFSLMLSCHCRHHHHLWSDFLLVVVGLPTPFITSDILVALRLCKQNTSFFSLLTCQTRKCNTFDRRCINSGLCLCDSNRWFYCCLIISDITYGLIFLFMGSGSPTPLHCQHHICHPQSLKSLSLPPSKREKEMCQASVLVWNIQDDFDDLSKRVVTIAGGKYHIIW